ncbi:Spore germination protein GerE [compost metagenome]
MKAEELFEKLNVLKSVLEKYGLSKREHEVIYYWILDLDYKEISKLLFISENTVRKHINNINHKFNVHSRASLILMLFLQLLNLID